jgi:nanoRNase/pAp phosphatase (c-di-AMP/oligoRNAs hydrolase)
MDETRLPPEENKENKLDEVLTERLEREREGWVVRRKKVEEMEKLFQEFSGHKMLIVVKGPPDPDSIACAWAHQSIAHHFGVEGQIIYFDPISHPENRALVKALGVEVRLYTPEMDLSEFSSYALVDTPSEDFPALERFPKDAPLFSLVDHHKKTGKVKARFVDIRENAGSTSAIYTEYLQYGKFTLHNNQAEHTALATALHHGIRSDTDNLFLAREVDWRAAAYLSQFADKDLLKLIASSSVTASMMDILQNGLASKEIRDNYLFAGVGFVRELDRDGIAQAADYLVRREGIDTAVVFGVVEEKYIHGSLRTRSTTVDPDIFLKEVFGADKETGKAYGGGRLDKGGFQIPLNIFEGCTDRDLLWQLVSSTIKAKFMKKLGHH